MIDDLMFATTGHAYRDADGWMRVELTTERDLSDGLATSTIKLECDVLSMVHYALALFFGY